MLRITAPSSMVVASVLYTLGSRFESWGADMEDPEKKFEGPVLIREAKPEDVPDIQEVFHKTWLDTYPNEAEGITRDDIEDRFKNAFSEETLVKRRAQIEKQPEDEKFIVAEVDGRIVGLCRADKKDGQNRLRAIYVLPEYQKRGIGQLLWGEAKKFFGVERDVFVSVATYNKNAIGFYEKLGFKDTGWRFSLGKFKMKSGNNIPQMKMVLKSGDTLREARLF